MTGENGHSYKLTLVAGQWRAEPLPLEIFITLPEGAGDVAVQRFEDGTYSYGGQAIRSGDSITVRGVSYVLTLSGTEGTAERQTVTTPGPRPPLVPGVGEPLTTDSLATYEGVRPRLSDDGDTDTRAGSILEINGELYSLADLSIYGWVEEETTFVENARERIRNMLGDIVALLSLTDSAFINRDIERRWDNIAAELDALFLTREAECWAPTPRRSATAGPLTKSSSSTTSMTSLTP